MKRIRLFVPIAVMLLIGITFLQRSFGATIADAESLLAKQEYSKAETIFQSFVGGSDSDRQREGFYGLGRVYYFQGDYLKARQNLESALACKQNLGLSPESQFTHTLAGIYVYLSYIAMQGGDYEIAIGKLKKAIDLGLADVNKKSFLGSNIYVLIAKNYLNLGDIDSARTYLTKSLALAIEDPAIALNIRQSSMAELGRCDLLSGDYAKAIARFDSMIANSKDDNNYKLAAYIGSASAYLLNGDYKKALTNCAEKLERLPAGMLKPKALCALGAIYFKNDDRKKAEAAYLGAIANVNGFGKDFRKRNYSSNFDLALAFAHYGLGVIYDADKKSDQALTEMSKTVALTKSVSSKTFFEKVMVSYLRIAAQNSVCDLLDATGKNNEAMKESADLKLFIVNLSPKERTLIEKKQFGVYIEGKPRL